MPNPCWRGFVIRAGNIFDKSCKTNGDYAGENGMLDILVIE